MPLILLLLQLSTTWFMTGLIWFVQIVHYPLYPRIGVEQFVAYERDHCSLTTLVVAPVMLTELFTAVLLLFCRPKFFTLSESIVGIVLLVLIWLLTVFIADQMHGVLGAGFNAPVVKSLVAYNWLRTILWTVRALILSYVVFKGLTH